MEISQMEAILICPEERVVPRGVTIVQSIPAASFHQYTMGYSLAPVRYLVLDPFASKTIKGPSSRHNHVVENNHQNGL
jgi:hypothetical protein